MEKNLLLVKENIKKLLEKIDFPGKVEVTGREEGYIVANIESPEASYLIGRGGETLDALQQIARNLVNKNNENPIRFIIDVNNYRKDRLDSLVSAAKNLARQALETKEDQWLPAMNAFERRVVHVALSDFEGVQTESEGFGEERKVVIKPRSM